MTLHRLSGSDRWEEATGVVIPHVPRKARVLALLKAHQGRWIKGSAICHPDIGGSEGLRRLRELRADGWPIEGPKRLLGSSDRMYCLPWPRS